MILILLFLNSLYSVESEMRTPTIIHITPDQIRDIGSTVELSCSVQYASQYSIIWRKVDDTGNVSIVISSGTTSTIRDSRFSLRYDTASTTYTLQIKDIQDTDAGIYKCQILMSSINYISKEVRLQVHSPPIIYDNSSSTIVVSDNTAVKLECYAGGVPKPQISWKRENNALLPTGGSVYKGNVLKINNVHKEDRGTYYCTADNKVGKNVKRSIAVEVEFPPIVRATKIQVGQALQFDTDLECSVEAFPSPVINWYKDGVQLANNQHYKISQFASVGEYTDTTLRVVSVESRQYGTYTCKGTNKLGESEATVELYETDYPVCPPACGSGHYSDSSVFSPDITIVFTSFIMSMFTCK